MNKQPWYHGASVLFTTTMPVTEEQFIAAMQKALKPYGVVYVEVEGEYMDPEAGDPTDLM
jgi:hypothetical protein